MVLRLLVVVVLLLGVVVATRLYQRWHRGLGSEVRATPLVPPSISAGAERTWLIFTTPYCASCGPIASRLRAEDPQANVVSIDAAEQPDLSRAFDVRSAPTVLLADAQGRVTARLVGPAAFDRYVRNPA